MTSAAALGLHNLSARLADGKWLNLKLVAGPKASDDKNPLSSRHIFRRSSADEAEEPDSSNSPSVNKRISTCSGTPERGPLSARVSLPQIQKKKSALMCFPHQSLARYSLQNQATVGSAFLDPTKKNKVPVAAARADRLAPPSSSAPGDSSTKANDSLKQKFFRSQKSASTVSNTSTTASRGSYNIPTVTRSSSFSTSGGTPIRGNHAGPSIFSKPPVQRVSHAPDYVPPPPPTTCRKTSQPSSHSLNMEVMSKLDVRSRAQLSTASTADRSSVSGSRVTVQTVSSAGGEGTPPRESPAFWDDVSDSSSDSDASAPALRIPQVSSLKAAVAVESERGERGNGEKKENPSDFRRTNSESRAPATVTGGGSSRFSLRRALFGAGKKSSRVLPDDVEVEV